MAVEVSLSQGMVALVDDDDLELVAPYKWHVTRDGRKKSNLYAVHSGTMNRPAIKMHRLITGAPPGVDVDHRDGNGLNNTRCNLRICSRRENAMNRPTQSGTSRFKGVSWDEKTRKWRAQLSVGGKRICIGRFASEKEAAVAYDVSSRDHYGEFAFVNFREEV